MSKLDTTPEVIGMAVALKLDPRLGAVKEILGHCHKRIAQFLKETGAVKTLDELQAVICRGLHLVFEEVWSDEDLVAVTKKYLAMGETAFASLGMQLDGETFATLMERHHVKAGAKDRYVAVIDCRGDKAARRYFTKWHEIAHLLTLIRQLELPFHRSTSTSEDPLEKLMDIIAGDVGFYTPLFGPAIEQELGRENPLTFNAVDNIRERVCREASFQATLNASVARTQFPVVLIEVGLGLKKAEAAALRTRQMSMFPTEKPKPKLRALGVWPNAAAREAQLTVHKNMAIPAHSVVARVFDDPMDLGASVGEEDLSIWQHSDGTPVGDGAVLVEARRIGTKVFAILQRPQN